jgi:hypothetical protein
MTRAAVILLACVALLGLSALGELGRAYASRSVFPGAQPNFSGDMGSRVVFSSSGPLQLGTACAQGTSGEVCLGDTLHSTVGASAEAIIIPTQARISFHGSGAPADDRTQIFANGAGNLRVGPGGGAQVGVAGHEFRQTFSTGGFNPITGTFANLGTPTGGNSTIKYCTDCNPGATCTSGGNGALAMRVNGAWKCL